MEILKNNFNKFSFSLIFLSVFLFMGVDVNQNTHINGDGAGTIKLTYSAKDADVTKNNSLIGNYPFDEAKVKEYFSSPGNNLIKSQVIKKDGIVYVNAEIKFSTVYKIKDMKGFAGTTSSFAKTDSGMVFYWNLKGNDPKQSGVIDKVTYAFTFDGEVKSTTGLLKNKEILYYRDTKTGNFNTDLFCAVTVSPSESKQTSSNSGSNQDNSGEGKSCGLFGFELPLVLLGGYAFALNRKRKVK